MNKPNRTNSISVLVSRGDLIKSITRKRDQEVKEHARLLALYEKRRATYRKAVTAALKDALKQSDPAALPIADSYDGRTSVKVKVGINKPGKPDEPSPKFDRLLKILSLGAQPELTISYDDYAAYLA